MAIIGFHRRYRCETAHGGFHSPVPDYADAHYNLGGTYMMAGDKDSAIKEYKILKTLDAEKAKNLFEFIYGETEPAGKSPKAQ